MAMIDDKVLQEANRLAQNPGKFGFVGYQANTSRKAGDWDYSTTTPHLTGARNSAAGLTSFGMSAARPASGIAGQSGYDRFETAGSTLQNTTIADSSGIMQPFRTSEAINGSPAVTKISKNNYHSTREAQPLTPARGSFSNTVSSIGRGAQQAKAQNVQSARMSGEIHGPAQSGIPSVTSGAAVTDLQSGKSTARSAKKRFF